MILLLLAVVSGQVAVGPIGMSGPVCLGDGITCPPGPPLNVACLGGDIKCPPLPVPAEPVETSDTLVLGTAEGAAMAGDTLSFDTVLHAGLQASFAYNAELGVGETAASGLFQFTLTLAGPPAPFTFFEFQPPPNPPPQRVLYAATAGGTLTWTAPLTAGYRFGLVFSEDFQCVKLPQPEIFDASPFYPCQLSIKRLE